MFTRVSIVSLLLLLLFASPIHAKTKKKQLLPDYVLRAERVLVVIRPDAGEPLTTPTANRTAQEDVENQGDCTTSGVFPHCATSPALSEDVRSSNFFDLTLCHSTQDRKIEIRLRETSFRFGGKIAFAQKPAVHPEIRKESVELGRASGSGVDEVGRGSLFGPVVAAAVILDPAHRIRGLRDSKLLPAERREVLAERIREHAVAWAIAAVDAARIDQINIYQASRLAMRQAVSQLNPNAEHLLVDALRLDCEIPQQSIIHGDALSVSIAAASIIAKVERDRMIVDWDPVFPVYGLASNKGYSTPRHLAALREHGPCPLHRQSFAPVWNAPVPQEALAFMLEDGERRNRSNYGFLPDRLGFRFNSPRYNPPHAAHDGCNRTSG